MSNRPYLIGISGGSGSGKTSLIRILRTKFKTTELCIVSQDDYYKPRDKQHKDSNGIINFDLPQCINKKQLLTDIHALLNGKKVVRKEYTFNNEQKTPKQISLISAPILIVEGLFVFHFKEIASLFDLKIFVQVKDNLKLIRRIHRDRTERNYPINDVLYRYEHHVLPAYEKYIKPYAEDADIIINNNHSLRNSSKVLTGFIWRKLQL